MKTVLILNGPPGVGKDTLANAIEVIAGFEVMSFKKPMFDIAQAMLGPVDFELFMTHYNDRDQKEHGQRYLNGKSPRQFMIWISEDFVKPMFGNQHFGKIASDSVQSSVNSIVFSDGGFPDEVIALHDNTDAKIVVARLYRGKCNFGNDSRNYISIPHLIGLPTYDEFDYVLSDGFINHDSHDILDIALRSHF